MSWLTWLVPPEPDFLDRAERERNDSARWALVDIARSLREIRVILTPRLSARLRIVTPRSQSHQGDHHMPATLPVGNTGTAQWQEWSGPNGTGDKLPPAGAVSFSSSDPSIATVDAGSGLVTAVAIGTATISGTDAANSLTASDTVTVTETAQSATLTVVPN